MKVVKSRYIIIGILIILTVWGITRLLNSTQVKVISNPTLIPSAVNLRETIMRHRAGEIPVVDLSAVTTFSWDRVYIFAPYAQLSEIDSVVGRSWREPCFTTIDSSEAYALLVFVKNNQYVECVEHPIIEGDFSSLAMHTSGFSAQEAKFRIDERGDMIWIESK